ncbi:hypothetical protein HAX54_010103 [Datura stramonium]|uniref:Uncharacterized protein n=1 Tax=Datura stramonium TaxID=4076 RepID=A0ABS8TGN4_DATST|nr:hypothetical protein [Datura stramonium]
MPEFQVYLNDLPHNDFNTTFNSIPSFYQNLNDGANCFVSGISGSFYGRLFPSKSMHLVHSSYSLHWLSQAPENMENNNNNNIYITRTSPPHVFEAYMKQFENDFSRFLQSRSEEIVTGGHMDEVEKVVQMEGSFDVDTLEFFQVNWDERDNNDFDAYNSGKHFAKTIRAVSQQILVSHFQFEESIIDYLFERYAYHAACHLLVQEDLSCSSGPNRQTPFSQSRRMYKMPESELFSMISHIMTSTLLSNLISSSFYQNLKEEEDGVNCYIKFTHLTGCIGSPMNHTNSFQLS